MKPRFGLAVLLFLALTVLACDFGDPFREYRGVNLLPQAAQEFSFTGPQTDWAWQPFVYDPTADAVAPATQNLGLLLDALDPGDPRAHLLIFEDAAADGGSGAARLEIPNLMPNGDFEAALSADWNPTGFTTFAAQAPAAGFAIDQNVLRIESTTADDTAEYALNNLSGGSPPTGAELFVRFSIRSEGQPTAILQLYNGTDTEGIQSLSAKGLTTETAPAEFPYDYLDIPEPETDIRSRFAISDSLGTDPVLVLPAGILEDDQVFLDGAIDNLRIGRADTRSYIRTVVPAEPHEGLRLASGSYRFSIEVRRDPTADMADPAKEPNRFPARGIAAELFPVGSSSGMTGRGRQLSDWEASDSWEQMVFLFENIQIPAEPAADALEIRLYANNPGDYERTIDIGSLLIRNPRLEFIP